MLTSLHNPLVKQLRKLHRLKERREQDLCLLEGTHLIQSACQFNYPLITVCCTPQWQEQHPQLWEEVARLAQRLELVSPQVLDAIATTVNPDGVVATAPSKTITLSLGTPLSLGLMLERLQDPGNLGTIIRTAAAVGADGMWLSHDSVDSENPKVMRASAGAWFQVPIGIHYDLAAVITHYQAQGVQIVATLPQARQTYWDINLIQPTLVLLGNEGAGLSDELVALAQHHVQIPLGQGVESLNVAIAAALILYEARRQRNDKLL